jgi:hypothetical protein
MAGPNQSSEQASRWWWIHIHLFFTAPDWFFRWALLIEMHFQAGLTKISCTVLVSIHCQC